MLSRFVGFCFFVAVPGAVASQEPAALPEADFWLPLSEELRLEGTHGELVVTAHLAPERNVSEVVVEQSTGSPELDEYAIAQLEQNGLPETHSVSEGMRARLTVMLYSFTLAQPIGSTYRCDQAVRDYDWFRRVHGEDSQWNNPLINFFGGAARVGGRSELRFLTNRDEREAAIVDSIAVCRNRPDSLFMRELFAAGN